MKLVVPRPFPTIGLRRALLLFTMRLVNGKLYQLVPGLSPLIDCHLARGTSCGDIGLWTGTIATSIWPLSAVNYHPRSWIYVVRTQRAWLLISLCDLSADFLFSASSLSAVLFAPK